MSNLKADITDLVRPVAGSCAVERVTLGIEWASELSSQVMQRLSNFLDEWDHPFPRKVEIHAKEFVGEGDAPPAFPRQDEIELVGIVLEHKPKAPSETIPNCEFSIRQTGFVFSAEDNYAGWSAIKEKALPLAGLLLDEIAKEVAIDSVGLQFVDVFYLMDDDVEFGRILNKDNINLPPRIFEDKNYWHLDQGFYGSNLVDDRQILTNLQVAYSPGDTSDKLIITCLHRVFVEDSTECTVGDLLTSYDTLYQKNKELIVELLQAEVSEMIGLTKHKGSLK